MTSDIVVDVGDPQSINGRLAHAHPEQREKKHGQHDGRSLALSFLLVEKVALAKFRRVGLQKVRCRGERRAAKARKKHLELKSRLRGGQTCCSLQPIEARQKLQSRFLIRP